MFFRKIPLLGTAKPVVCHSRKKLGMKNNLLRFWSHHTTLFVGGIASIFMLLIFLILQYNEPKVLKLEFRWLLVAGVPLLASLIVGGYIKSFKGFGVELEASLSKPVTNIELTATEAMDEVPGNGKKSINYLRSLNPKLKKSISRLILVQGRKKYYQPRALEIYLRELSGLKYIEIRKPEG